MFKDLVFVDLLALSTYCISEQDVEFGFKVLVLGSTFVYNAYKIGDFLKNKKK